MKNHVGRSDILFVTLDTLRYDVAQQLFLTGQLPNFSRYLPSSGWQRRHSPATFTYAAHHAFFAGFLPTDAAPGLHPRIFASAFGGSETTTADTFVFPQATLPEALSGIGYHTLCIGGTGFFNPANALGRVLPALFDEAVWSERMSVVDRRSAVHQVDCAIDRIERQGDKRVFCFINFSAIHQPNWFYADESNADESDTTESTAQHRNPPSDTIHSHGQALVSIDREWERLIQCFRSRGTLYTIVCSDHGTAYGESGYFGHRLAHSVVYEVPYAQFEI